MPDRTISAPTPVLSIEHTQRIQVSANGTATRGYDTYIKKYVGMLESGLLAKLSGNAYKVLDVLGLRSRPLGDPHRRGAEDEFQFLLQMRLVKQEDRGQLFCFVGREQIMMDAGIHSVHTVDHALDELAKLQLIERIVPHQQAVFKNGKLSK